MQKWIHRRNYRFNISNRRQVPNVRGIKLNAVSWNHGGPNLDCEILLRKACDSDILVFASSECGGTFPDFFVESDVHLRWRSLLAVWIGGEFVHLGSERLQGIVVSVWISKKLNFQDFVVIRSCRMHITRERMGRKGAVMMLIRYGSIRITLVSAHLAAHTDAFRERTYQLHKIIREAQSLNRNQGVILIIGDLNFRIEAKSHEIIRWLELGDVDKILAADQLSKLLNGRPKWLVGWYEALRPSFLPTYKVNPRGEHYAVYRRSPAYTDRILIWSSSTQHVHTIEYYKASHSFGSDHFPIMGRFIIETCG
jgi:endonuclease/exonuclease/phosphatase family metal-dependent hydrolase